MVADMLHWPAIAIYIVLFLVIAVALYGVVRLAFAHALQSHSRRLARG